MDDLTLESWQEPGPGAPKKQGLTLTGSITIGQAAGLKTALLDALGAASGLRVDLSGITEIDLTGLQLLCAAHRSARLAGKQFSVNDGGNSIYSDAVIGAGFSRNAGCARDKSCSCIWVGGEC